MKNSLFRLVLFNSPKGIGGTPTLVIRMARQLAGMGVPVDVIDLHSGYVSEELRKVGMAPISRNSSGITAWGRVFPRDTVLVGFNHDPFAVADLFEPRSVPLLIWDVFPPYWLNGFLRVDVPVVGHVVRRLRSISRVRRKIAESLMNRSGVVFMDETGRENMEALTEQRWPGARIVPIPIASAPTPRGPRARGSRPLSFVYIGRADPWKVAPARRLVKDFGPRLGVEWTIVTNSASTFRSLLDCGQAGHVTVVEGLHGVHLDRLLLDRADVCFGMGTSCLEGAKLGVPAVLLDFVQGREELPLHYGYRWLFQEPGYCLGRDVTHLQEVGGLQAEGIVADALNDGDAVGRLCWKTAQEKFDIDTVAAKLLAAAQETHLMLADLTGNNLFRLARLGQRLRPR